MSPLESEVLIRRDEIVRIHLDRLQSILETSTPSKADAVHASIALRVLFDGVLNRTAHAHSQHLMIPAPDTSGIPLGQALFFACGGYSLGGVSYRPAYHYRAPGLQSPYRAQFEEHVAASPKTHAFSELRLKAFLGSPCLVLMGRVFSREQTVRYVANKCGGAHHSDDTAKFEDFELGLTDLGRVMHADGVSAVFLETLGTASLLMAAPSVQLLASRIAVAEGSLKCDVHGA